MLKKLGVLPLVLALGACGLGADDTALTNKAWQTTGIYLSPGSQQNISDTVVEVPTVTFGRDSMLGTTGCQRFMGSVTYDRAEDNQIAAVTIDSMAFDEAIAPDCTGDRLWAHNTLSRLYSPGNAFDVAIDKNDQLILTLHDDLVDSPAVRFVSP